MPKEQTYWCVYDPEGNPRLHSIEWTKHNAIHSFIKNLKNEWPSFRKRGYTVQKVTINIVTK